MRIDSWVGVTATLLAMFSGVIAAEPQQCRRNPLPANVDLAHDLARVLVALRSVAHLQGAVRADCNGRQPARHSTD